MDYIFLFLIGALGGFLSGFIGIGGGIIYVTVFPFFLARQGIESDLIVPMTLANSILGILIASGTANFTEILKKEFYWKESIAIGLSSSIAAIITLKLVAYQAWYSREKFTLILIGILIYLMVGVWKQSGKSENRKEQKPHYFLFPLVGIFAGLVASLSGLGGGAVIIPILSGIVSMSIKKAKSISLGVIFISSVFITLYNYYGNPINNHLNLLSVKLVLPIAIGIIIMSPIGVLASKRASQKFIGVFFSSFLLLIIIYKIMQL